MSEIFLMSRKTYLVLKRILKYRIQLTLSVPYLYENAIPSAKFIFGKIHMLVEKYAQFLWKTSER